VAEGKILLRHFPHHRLRCVDAYDFMTPEDADMMTIAQKSESRSQFATLNR
jgi:hypothetical protein